MHYKVLWPKKSKGIFLAGEVLIEPSEGVAANTTFIISAGDGWSVDEEDGPLVYRCGCVFPDRRGRKKPKYFVEFSEKDSCETTLPPGKNKQWLIYITHCLTSILMTVQWEEKSVIGCYFLFSRSKRREIAEYTPCLSTNSQSGGQNKRIAHFSWWLIFIFHVTCRDHPWHVHHSYIHQLSMSGHLVELYHNRL